MLTGEPRCKLRCLRLDLTKLALEQRLGTGDQYKLGRACFNLERDDAKCTGRGREVGQFTITP